ncbi:DNA/RNA nuclease SfsA [Thalassotalea piscium]
MIFTPLSKAILIKRYKRFLADITLPDDSVHIAHCANTGAMTGCATPGDTIWYSTSSNPKRKYPFSWEITQTQQGDFICVNTLRANQLVEEAIRQGHIEQFLDYQSLQREVKYGNENSKIDFKLQDNNNNSVYIEVKSVTLLHHNQGYFPDAVTARGQKHLRELIEMVEQGHKAVLLFAVLHSGINSVKPADYIDPQYTKLLAAAKNKGVEILAIKGKYTPIENGFELTLDKMLPVILD